MPQQAGKTVAQIRRELGIPDVIDIRAAEPGAAQPRRPNPLEEAIEYRNALLAQGVMRSATDEADAGAQADAMEAKLRAEKMRLEVAEVQDRLDEHRRARRGEGDGEGSVLVKVLEVMQQDKQMLAQQTEHLRAELIATLRQETADLRQEIMARQSNGHQPAPSSPSMSEQLQEIQATWQQLNEMFGTGGQQGDLARTGGSIEDVIKLHQAQEAHEERMMQMRMQGERWQRQIALEEQKVAVDDRRGQNMSEIAQRAIPHLQNIANSWAQGRFGASPEPAAPATAPQPETIPAGSQLATCQCRQLLVFPPGEDVVTCPQCGAAMRLPIAAAPAPEPEAPAAPPPASPGADERLAMAREAAQVTAAGGTDG